MLLTRRRAQQGVLSRVQDGYIRIARQPADCGGPFVFGLQFIPYASTTLILLVADDCIRPSNSLCSVLVQESQPNRCMWSLRPNPDHAELQIIYVRMTAVAIRDQPPC